jgi:flavodoxin
MRRFLALIAALLTAAVLAACGAQTVGQTASETQSAAASSAAKGHILVAYFLQAGEQYDVGVVEKGNTQIVAEMIAEETGADLFHIERKAAYPSKLSGLLDEAQDEQKNSARPELAAAVDNWDDYDTIFLGYPIWWGDMPMPVYTFLESYDFTGKTVIPFDTNGGSGLADTVNAITKACPGATVRDGLAVSGKEAQTQQDKAKSEVQNWLKGLGY